MVRYGSRSIGGIETRCLIVSCAGCGKDMAVGSFDRPPFTVRPSQFACSRECLERALEAEAFKEAAE